MASEDYSAVSDYGSYVTDDPLATTAAAAPPGNIFQPQGAMLYTYIISGCLGTLGNALVVIVMFRFTNLTKKLTNIFIIHQSMVDFLVSVVLLLLTGTQKQHYVPGVAGDILCRIWLSLYVLWTLLSISTYNLCLLSLEKYFAIVHPILHKQTFSFNKAIIGIVTAWILGIISNLFNTTTSGIRGVICYRMVFWPSKLAQRATGVTNCLLKFFLPLALMLYTYGRILHVLNTKVAPGQTSTSGAPNKFGKAKRNTVKLLVLVCSCFIFCWSFNQFFFMAFNLGAPLSLTTPFYQFSVIAVFINSCINPFIYVFKFEEFQKGLRDLFGGCLPKKKRPDTNSDQPVSTTMSSSGRNPESVHTSDS